MPKLCVDTAVQRSFITRTGSGAPRVCYVVLVAYIEEKIMYVCARACVWMEFEGTVVSYGSVLLFLVHIVTLLRIYCAK